ncbi:abortive infection family protein [Brevundimonas sp.]|uniref:abortive infection family protein n=1 Tax=Brevundimonas sp. TaxID=1871086 RepID=UPI003F6EA7F7
MTSNRIPPAIIGTVAPILSQRYSHDQLDALFMSAGFPGDPPERSKPAKVMEWLRRANAECEDDALDRFARLIAEFMDTEPAAVHRTLWSGEASEDAADPRETVLDCLKREGLTYRRGGYIVGGTLSGPSKSLAERLAKDGVVTVETEYQRAYEQVESDPPAAVTAACAILEAVCKTYLATEGHPLPNKQVLGTLWSETAAHLGLRPKDVADLDLKRILSGLSSIADGVAALRTHRGSAHGHSDGGTERKPYRLAARHARLAVHAAHTMALFVLETWEARRGPKVGASR